MSEQATSAGSTSVGAARALQDSAGEPGTGRAAGARTSGSAGNDVQAPSRGSALARLTVVIPVGPGDQLDARLRAQLAQLPVAAQICIVTCKESAPGVAHAPSEQTGDGPRWVWISAPAGRASQQNAGAAAAAVAAAAAGQWLWFLHADAQLADGTLPALEKFIHADHAALGYFDLRFLDDGPALMRLNAAGAWLRSHWLRLPFGDQGLLLPHALFTKLGGFDATVARGEDHQLVWRARRAGIPVLWVGASLYTSARRYAAGGWGTTTRQHVFETWRQARSYARGETRP